jgi:hypothetical protein
LRVNPSCYNNKEYNLQEQEEAMAETLGKIEKPETSQFKQDRKLFFVPLVLLPVSEDPKLSELLDLYWQETGSQIKNLSAKLGNVTKVYHELVSSEEEILTVLEGMHSGSHSLVKSSLGNGAIFQAVEDRNLLNEFMDWSRCLAIGLQCSRVFDLVYQNYLETYRKRNENISKNIDETLTMEDIGLLFLREGHHVQFPTDIQVFFVAPPSLDAIHRHLREIQEQALKETPPENQPEAGHQD